MLHAYLIIGIIVALILELVFTIYDKPLGFWACVKIALLWPLVAVCAVGGAIRVIAE